MESSDVESNAAAAAPRTASSGGPDSASSGTEAKLLKQKDPVEIRRRKESWTAKASNLHRVVEQIDDEPLAIIVFKWALIAIGLVMLGIVIVFMGEVVYLWSTGVLHQQKMWAVANFTARMKNKSDEMDLDLTDPVGGI